MLYGGMKYACRGGHMDIALLMIEKGANDWYGGMFNACYSGDMDIINLLLIVGVLD